MELIQQALDAKKHWFDKWSDEKEKHRALFNKYEDLRNQMGELSGKYIGLKAGLKKFDDLATTLEKLEGSGLVVEERKRYFVVEAQDGGHWVELNYEDTLWNSARLKSLLLLAKNFTVERLMKVAENDILIRDYSDYLFKYSPPRGVWDKGKEQIVKENLTNLATAIRKEFVK